jgi:2,4-dienoyl-CoA reductase-like NADH-dependent reductase (Old Yellow Enzyme family)
MYKDAHIENLSRVTKFVEANGAVPAIQLGHAGRKGSTRVPGQGGTFLPAAEGGWQHVAPSAIPFRPEDGVPHALTVGEIGGVVEAFAAAAKRAVNAGFKLIELHAAHGYLLNEFMSPLSNTRTDQYGGSFENRIRATIETIKAMRSVMPSDMPLFMKISAVDWAEGGWDVTDSVKLAREAKAAGVDLVVCSSGAVVMNQQIKIAPLYQVPFAEQVKRESGAMTGAVGLITTAQQANDVLSASKADMIVMAREFLRDPYFPLHAAKTLGAEIPFPKQYRPAFI